MSEKEEIKQNKKPEVEQNEEREVEQTEESSTEENASPVKGISRELYDDMKRSLLEELKNQDLREREELEARRAEEQEKRDDYVERMKVSNEPWVDFVSQSQSGGELKVELDWNDAYVEMLREAGVTGIDDDQVVQKYIAVLMRDVANQMDETSAGETDSEFE